MTRLAPLLAAFLPLLAACDESSGGFLDVSFDRLDVHAIDWEAVDTDFVFRIDNPNPVQFSLSRFDYTLSFAGVEWLSGDDPDGLVVAASGGSEVALPALVGFEALYEVVQATRGEDTIPFTLEGSFGFETPWGELELPYAADGDFPALRTPRFAFRRLAVDAIDTSGAALAVEIDVDNDLGSTLEFTNFDYTLSLEGSRVATGLVEDLGGAAGAETTTIDLPVEIDWIDAGTGVWDALTGGGAVSVGLAASTDVDTPFGVVPLSIDESGQVSVDP